MIFNGAYEHTIDAKNRLAIPAPFREKIDPERDGRKLYIVPGSPTNTLWIFTEKYFEAITTQLGSGLLRDEGLVAFEQEVFSNTADVEPDTQGRIVIPDWMLRAAGVGRDVMVCGVRDHMEVRRRDEWEKRLSAGSWKGFAELTMKAREALRAEEKRKAELGRSGP